MQLSSTQRKCLNIFKEFVQKALIPQIKNSSGSLTQWNIFQSLVSAPNLNINEIQYFVDNLSLHPSTKQDKTIISKKQQQFQPKSPLGKNLHYINKTFGGQIKRNNCSLNEQVNSHHRRQSTREEIIKQQKLAASNGVMEGLQKFLKSLQENQKIIDYLSVEVQISMVNNNRVALHQLAYNNSKNMGGTVYSTHPYSTINNYGNNQSRYVRTSY